MICLWSELHPPLQDLFWEECWEEAPSSPSAMEMSVFSRLLLNASQVWQLNTLTWAWYHRLHFYIFMLNVIQWSTYSHLHHVLFWTCTEGKAAIFLFYFFCTWSHLFCLFISFCLSPYCLSGGCCHLCSTITSMLCCLDQAPAPPLSTSMFFLKNKIPINGGEKAVALCCEISFYFLCFSICHFVLLEIQEQCWKMWLIKM